MEVIACNSAKEIVLENILGVEGKAALDDKNSSGDICPYISP
jgi:hypothetical protein